MRKLIRWFLRGIAALFMLGFVSLLFQAATLRSAYQTTADSIQTSAYGFGQMLILIPTAFVVMLIVGILWYVSRKV